MAFDPFSAALEMGTSIINKIWPDPVKQAEEVRKLQELAQAGDIERMNAGVKLLLGQLEINKIEAASKSLFVAGARPFIIWGGGFSMVWTGVIHPMLTWVWAFSSMDGTPPPVIESGALTAIVSALLGVGTMRSFDKSKKVETNSIGKQ